ncbi:hypothetical protein M378DRAFT_183991 [Amanita muscaria Koide BX008]|uniref:Uncharacterized protein n=1 Tax=Amanita muscaria (strain Koide BX008) TaxID=946122 RepID=A0A0C2X5I4_AMAMK|nr:hypothetical protein M378DRAFT_183991 [Amanita muscaria Koide BX008]
MSTSSFAPTSPETALVNQIFNQFDPQKLGVLTGDVAVKAFAAAKLPPTVLREIWDLADEDNKGWLSRRGASIAVRLIGWAQKGQKVSSDLLARPGPLPSLEGVTVVSQQNTGLALKSPTIMSLPPLTTQDRAKFHSLFYKANPQNGLITAEKAGELFLKSKLSNDQLSQIWNLADTQDRGSLDITDFTIGMYFIQAVMSRQLSVIPLTIPPGLYQQATGSSQTSGSHMSNNSGSFSPTSSNFSQYKTSGLQPQSTGQSVLQPTVTGTSLLQKVQPNMSARPAVFGSGPFPLPTATAQWDVSPNEKVAADKIFNGLDVHKHGYIEGDVAVPVMLKSNLPGEDLARVWDLADLDNNGRLTRDCFALAMHLIHKRLSGQELPAVLPPSLIPPSFRNGSAANPTPYSPVTQQQPPEPVNDLFSFDEPPPAPVVPSQITGETAGLQPQQTGQKFPSPLNQKPTTIFPPRSLHNVLSDPFNPSSSFNLLGDDDSDERATSPLEDKSAEIGNAQNQLNSTNRSLEAAKTERGTVEQLLADQSVQLGALQTQISFAKAAYDAETKLLANLKERQTNQLTEIQKLREELIHAESDLSAIRVEKAEMEGSFLRDKEDARDLHRKMLQVSQEADRLRQELERVKKEAKQQKGLLAIAKKQLTTKEAERAKVEKELREAVDELTSITAERETIESEQTWAVATPPVVASPERGLSPDSVTFAAQHPLPSTPEIQGGGVGRSNNPFGKFNLGSATTPGGPGQATTIRSFSFENAFMVEESASHKGVEPVQLNGTGEANANTPKSHPTSLELTSFPEVASPVPDSELFETPPTSSSIQSGPSSPAVPSSSSTPFTAWAAQQEEDASSGQSFEATVAHYPAIEDLSTQFPAQGSSELPGSFPLHPEAKQDKLQGPAVTDLNAELKELDADEPDSDNEEIPLAELKKKNNETNADLSLGGDNGEPSKAIFDDIFGVTPATAEPINNVQQPRAESNIDSIFKPADNASTTPLGVPAVEGPSNLPAVQNVTNITGISAFDAALGRISSQNEVAVSNSVAKDDQFTFDDNFDFSSSSGAAARLSVLGSEPLTSWTRGPTSVGPVVEDGFKLFTPLGQTQASATSALKPLSFDDAFANPSSRHSVDTSNDHSLQDIIHQETASDVLSSSKTLPPTSAEEKPSPRISDGSPESLVRSPSPAPQRTKSPPPPKRISSPKSRQSTSSNKDEKQGNLPVRHSKLSLRLPFVGKRKKHQEAQSTPLPSTQNLSAPLEEEDAAPVKQLTSMGFGRAEAIEALERNAYDVPKALNALLGGAQ